MIKKLVFITGESFDTQNANYHMAEKLIAHLLSAGIDVHLIQSCKDVNGLNIPKALELEQRFTADSIVRNQVNKNNFILRYLNSFIYILKAMRRLNKQKNADAIYLQSYPTMVFMIHYIRLFIKKPLIYSIYDIFPGHAYDIGVIKNRLVFNILQWIQKPCYTISNFIIVLSEDMMEKAIELGAEPKKIRIVAAWYNADKVKEVSREDNIYIKEWGMNPLIFYIQYAGNFGHVFDFKPIIKAAEILKESNIIFQMIGSGNIKDAFVNEVKERRLDNIVFYPWQPVEQVANVYSACDIAIIPLKRGVIGNSVPSKAALIMACKKAIINVVEDSHYARIFKDNSMGISVDNNEIDALVNAILHCRANKNALELMAENAKNYSEKYYSSEVCLRRFMDVLAEI